MLVGNREVERVLGGGIVPGSMILLGGEPGIGKSTLALQIPLRCKGLRTLYVSGEESPRQIKLRAMRLLRKEDGEMEDNCTVLGETLVDNIIKYAQELTPDLLVVDSIQTIYTDSVESAASSVTQIRECAARLLRLAKESGIPVILIGHITKDGAIAGPKVLEHIVDVVLQFEGDIRHSHRAQHKEPFRLDRRTGHLRDDRLGPQGSGESVRDPYAHARQHAQRSGGRQHRGRLQAFHD